MKPLLIFFLSISLMGCNEIVVDENDSTPPSITATIVGSQNFAVYEDTGESAAGTALDPNRSVLVRPRNDREKIQLLISASDSESGIRLIESRITVSYRCVARILGSDEYKDLGKTFSSGLDIRPLEHGEEGNDTSVALASFTYKDLWTPACMHWGQIIDVREGRLVNIEVEYVGTAINNALQRGEARINGSFKVANGRASVD